MFLHDEAPGGIIIPEEKRKGRPSIWMFKRRETDRIRTEITVCAFGIAELNGTGMSLFVLVGPFGSPNR